jgi:hypothetical protein
MNATVLRKDLFDWQASMLPVGKQQQIPGLITIWQGSCSRRWRELGVNSLRYDGT